LPSTLFRTEIGRYVDEYAVERHANLCFTLPCSE